MPIDTAVVGLGAIGFPVAAALHRGIPGLKLVAVAARQRDVAAQRLASVSMATPVLTVDEIAERAELAVECVPPEAFRGIAERVLSRGRTLLTVSGAALIENAELVSLAERTGGRIVLVTGA